MATKHENLVKKCMLVMSRYGFICIPIKVGIFRSLYSNAIINMRDNEGVLDIIAIAPNGQFWAVDVKIGKDKLRTSQKAFCRAVTARGGVAMEIKDTTEELEKELERWKKLNT